MRRAGDDVSRRPVRRRRATGEPLAGVDALVSSLLD